MAIVVESTAINSATSTNTLTITKPSGLAEGDLMVAPISMYDGAGGDDINTPSGWTAVASKDRSFVFTVVFWKVATSADVAASNFTFTTTGTSSLIAGGIMRVSGVAVGSEVNLSTTAELINTGGITSPSLTISQTPSVDNTLIVMMIAGWNNNTGVSMSGYAVGGDTVTFTELYDYNSGQSVLGVAYGIQDTATALTSFGATISASLDDFAGSFVVFTPRVDATGTNTLVTTTSEAFSQSGTAGATTENTLATATAASLEQSGRVDAVPTAWTNEEKPSTIWTNEEKL